MGADRKQSFFRLRRWDRQPTVDSLGEPRQLLNKALLTVGPQRQQSAALRLEDARDRLIDSLMMTSPAVVSCTRSVRRSLGSGSRARKFWDSSLLSRLVSPAPPSSSDCAICFGDRQ
jgi:hypothetical protein